MTSHDQKKNLKTFSPLSAGFFSPSLRNLCVLEGAEVAGATVIAHNCILRDALNSVPPLLCASGAVPSRQLSNGAWRCKKRARGGRDRLRNGLCSLVPACKTHIFLVTRVSPPHFLWASVPPFYRPRFISCVFLLLHIWWGVNLVLRLFISPLVYLCLPLSRRLPPPRPPSAPTALWRLEWVLMFHDLHRIPFVRGPALVWSCLLSLYCCIDVSTPHPCVFKPFLYVWQLWACEVPPRPLISNKHSMYMCV